MPSLRKPVSLAGRALLGGFLLMNAMNHFQKTKGMAQYAASKDVPAPTLAVLGTGSLLAFSGVSILTGYRPKLGIAAATAFFAGTSYKMHDYWNIGGEEKQGQQINFMKNMAILGGTLALSAIPEPWPISIKTKEQKATARRRIASDVPDDVEAEYRAPVPT